MPSVFSDHLPIVLQIDFGEEWIMYPFKFNKIWLEEPDFNGLVINKWATLSQLMGSFPMATLVSKLKALKFDVIRWERAKKRELKEK